MMGMDGDGWGFGTDGWGLRVSGSGFEDQRGAEDLDLELGVGGGWGLGVGELRRGDAGSGVEGAGWKMRWMVDVSSEGGGKVRRRGR